MQNRKKLILSLAVLFIVNIVIISLVQRAGAVTYKKGSSGQIVKEIQTKLKQWGYFKGSVDGVYGSHTVNAIKEFQKKNGLTVDGMCGAQTLKAIGISNQNDSGETTDNKAGDLSLLARLISAEARGEPYNGQVAVGACVLNRIKHPSFPSTMSGVIYQSGAFSCITDGQFDQPVIDSAYRAAEDALNGVDPSGGAIYYFNPSKTTNEWIWSRPLIIEIGNHRFCA